METEKLRILKMLEDKKITADEAARLLEALDKVDARPSERDIKRRWIHIKVERDGDEVTNVRVPLALLKLGFKLAPHALNSHSAKAERLAEHARERAERAREKAERVKEKIRRRLEAKLGPDADLSDLNGAFAEALEGLGEVPEPPRPPHAPFSAGGLEGFDLDIEKIIEMANEDGFDGKILDVYDDEEEKRVTIRLE